MVRMVEGTVPYANHVSRRLAAAGFKRSVKTTRNISEGFRASDHWGTVSVHWAEALEDTIQRMHDASVTDVSKLPPNPLHGQYLAAYADVLDPWWRVDKNEGGLHLRVRDSVVEQAGISILKEVKGALRSAGVGFASANANVVRGGVAVTREPGYVRLMVRPWVGRGPWDDDVVHTAVTTVENALQGASLRFAGTDYECPEGVVIKVHL